MGCGGDHWTALSWPDYAVLGFVGTFQTLVALVAFHLLWCRKWPPYVSKNVTLVAISVLSSVVWTGTLTISQGFWWRQRGDVLADCTVEGFLVWFPMAMHITSFFIRIYRMRKILIQHDSGMWRTECQVAFGLSVCLIPFTIRCCFKTHFNQKTNTCHESSLPEMWTLAVTAVGLSAVAYLWFVYARQLKDVRRQFNEYRSIRQCLLVITALLISHPVIMQHILVDHPVASRRVALFYPVLTTHIICWSSILEPFVKKMAGDRDYLLSFTRGLSEQPPPAKLKASLAEQLSIAQLRTEFRTYIKNKIAHELIDFYQDSLDREEVADYFERQAVTMRIIEQYIREGAPNEVNISWECRQRVLSTHVTAHDIFDQARTEVLSVMETNFQKGFVKTEGFRRILSAAEEEEREIRVLKAGGMLPGTPEPTPGQSLPYHIMKCQPQYDPGYRPPRVGDGDKSPALHVQSALPVKGLERCVKKGVPNKEGRNTAALKRAPSHEVANREGSPGATVVVASEVLSRNNSERIVKGTTNLIKEGSSRISRGVQGVSRGVQGLVKGWGKGRRKRACEVGNKPRVREIEVGVTGEGEGARSRQLAQAERTREGVVDRGIRDGTRRLNWWGLSTTSSRTVAVSTCSTVANSTQEHDVCFPSGSCAGQPQSVGEEGRRGEYSMSVAHQ